MSILINLLLSFSIIWFILNFLNCEHLVDLLMIVLLFWGPFRHYFVPYTFILEIDWFAYGFRFCVDRWFFSHNWKQIWIWYILVRSEMRLLILGHSYNFPSLWIYDDIKRILITLFIFESLCSSWASHSTN